MPMLEDLRFAIRMIRKSPGFASIAIFTLALAIGANSAIFSVVNGVLLKPLPYNETERLVGVWHTAPGLNFPLLNASPSTYFTYREEGRVFEQIGLYDNDSLTVTGLGEPEQVDAMEWTESVLQVLRVAPALGRAFTAKDMQVGSPDTVMMSYSYWQRRFGGTPDTVGKTMTINGRPFEIIGILPQNFRFLDERADLFTPLQFKRESIFVGNFSYESLARLKPGVTIEQANADVARMLPLMMEKFPMAPGISKQMFVDAKFGPKVRPLKEDVVGDAGNVLWVLMGVAGVVLAIACANVANLLLVRAEGRQQELALRTALGAHWTQIARKLLVESMTLGIIGGVLGLGVAWGGVKLLVSKGPANLPRLDQISIDGFVLLYTLGVALLSGLLFGLIPVFKYATPHLSLALRDGGRGSSEGREHHRTRKILVVSQVALALVLLISSGLMIRTFQSMRNVQPGFQNPSQVLTMKISIPEGQVKESVQVLQMQQRIIQGIQAVPGVVSATMSNTVTMDGSTNNDPIFAEDFPSAEGKLPPIRRFKFVAPESFKTFGNPLIAGRDLTWSDMQRMAPVVLINEALAREYWKDPAKALGRRIKESPKSEWREIIGVVGNEYDNGVHKEAPKIVYWPSLLANFWGDKFQVRRTMSFVVRSPRVGSAAFLKEVQAAVWAVNPSLPTANVRTLQAIYDRSMVRTTFTLLMLALAGGVALILGVVGIYGVIAYAVSRRTREIGIRIALGAQQGQVQGLFVRDGAVLIAIGLVLGLAASAGVTRTLSTLLFGVKPMDVGTYAVVSAGLAVAALLACYLPARRATSVDPASALRSE
jgi:predicted permease